MLDYQVHRKQSKPTTIPKKPDCSKGRFCHHTAARLRGRGNADTWYQRQPAGRTVSKEWERCVEGGNVTGDG